MVFSHLAFGELRDEFFIEREQVFNLDINDLVTKVAGARAEFSVSLSMIRNVGKDFGNALQFTSSNNGVGEIFPDSQ